MTNSRNKGQTGEREAAEQLNRLFGCSCSRHGQTKAADGADLRDFVPGVHVEVKRVEALSLYKALSQAIADCGDNLPLVLHRRSHKPWVAVVRLDDLPRLVERLYLILASEGDNE